MPDDDGTTLKCEGSNPRLPNSALEDSIVLTVMCKSNWRRISTSFWLAYVGSRWRCSYRAQCTLHTHRIPYENIKIKVSCFARHANRSFIFSAHDKKEKIANIFRQRRSSSSSVLFCIKITCVSHWVVHTHSRAISNEKLFVVHLEDSAAVLRRGGRRQKMSGSHIRCRRRV